MPRSLSKLSRSSPRPRPSADAALTIEPAPATSSDCTRYVIRRGPVTVGSLCLKLDEESPALAAYLMAAIRRHNKTRAATLTRAGRAIVSVLR
jgi:hypothetical protein